MGTSKTPTTSGRGRRRHQADPRRRTYPPAYFLWLELENVRCFGKKQRLILCDEKERPRQWTVLLGDNGTGKTTVLQALASLEPRFHREKGRDGFLGPIAGQYPPETVRSFMRSGARAGSTIQAAVGVQGKLEQSSSKHIELLDWGVSHRGGRGIGSVPPAWQGLVCYGYGAARRMGAPTMSDSEEYFKQFFGASATLFLEGASLRNAEEWLLRTDYAASRPGPEQTRARSRLEKVKRVLTDKLLPDISEIRIAPAGNGRETPSVDTKTPYGWVPMAGLSLGYQTMVAWMVDLAACLFDRYPDSRDPLKEPAIVLVDEIDLHLHPKWQRTIQSYLTGRFPNAQFIVTAHSPLVVQAAGEANVVLLRREGDHVVIDNNPARIKGWRIDQVLTSELFGLSTARPPEIEAVLAEREKLIRKVRRTKADKTRLRKLNAIVHGLPGAETPEDAEAMDIVRRAASRIKEIEGEDA